MKRLKFYSQLIIISLFLASCHMHRYTLIKTGEQTDLFVAPPSEILLRDIAFKKDGSFRGSEKRKGKALVSIHNLKTSGFSDSKEKVIRFKRFDISERSQQEILLESQTVDSTNERKNFKLVVEADLFDDGYMDIRTEWNYNLFYDEDRCTFDYLTFTELIDELRIVLDKLQSKKWSRPSNGDNYIYLEHIALFVNSRGDELSMASGQHQFIMNSIFDRLVLPNELTLYNYGYLPEPLMDTLDRKRYVYFLDEELGLNTVYNPAQKDSICDNKPIFSLGMSAHMDVVKNENNKLFINPLLHSSLTDNEDCNGISVGNSPIDFSKLNGNYLILSTLRSRTALRNPTYVIQQFIEDVCLIGVNGLLEVNELLNCKIIGSIQQRMQFTELANAKKLYTMKSNLGNNYNDRFFFSPTMPVFICARSPFRAYIHFGATPDQIILSPKLNIRREQLGNNWHNKIHKRVKGGYDRKESLDLISTLLVQPNDKIR